MTVEEIRTTVCKVEVEETTTSVIIGSTVVLGAEVGEDVIVVPRTLDDGTEVVIVDPSMVL